MPEYTPEEDEQFAQMAVGAQGAKLRELAILTAQIALEIKFAQDNGDNEAIAHQGVHLAQVVFSMPVSMLPSYALHIGDEVNRRTQEGLDVFAGLRDNLPLLRAALSEVVPFIDFRGLDAMARVNDAVAVLGTVLTKSAYAHLMVGEGGVD